MKHVYNFLMQKTLKAFRDAMKGLKTVLKEERNFKIEIFVSVLVVLSSFFLGFETYEVLPLVIVIFMVLTAEIVNTAVEDLCDKIEPNYSSVIGKVKDVMAAYVLLSVIGAIVVGLLVVGAHFHSLLVY